jgi:hypothetical protein
MRRIRHPELDAVSAARQSPDLAAIRAALGRDEVLRRVNALVRG